MASRLVNKVVYGNSTLIDLTSDTVTASALASGTVAHDARGVQITGTAAITDPNKVPRGVVDGTAVNYYDDNALSIHSSTTFNTLKHLETATLTKARTASNSAFYNLSTLTAVSMDSLEVVPPSCFMLCTNLRDVYMPMVSEIKGHAFSSAFQYSITDSISGTVLNFPNLESIGGYAFVHARQIIELRCPKLKNLQGNETFSNCSKISILEVGGVRNYGMAFSGCKLTDVIYNDISISAFSSSGNYIANPFLTGLASGHTDSRNISINFHLPITSYIQASACLRLCWFSFVDAPNLLEIGSNGLNGNWYMLSGSFPKLSIVGTGAFAGCSSLSAISLPAVTSLGGGALRNCASLKEVYIPNALGISDYTFAGCMLLSSISIPKASFIGISAFYNCSSLTTITETSNVKQIGREAFRYTGLLSADFPNATFMSSISGPFSYCSYLSFVSMPKATLIPEHCFAYCSNLQEVYMPLASTIYSYAFTGAFQISGGRINLANATTLYNGVFVNCSGLEEARLPKITTIPASTFISCTNLKILEIGNVTGCGNNAFSSFGYGHMEDLIWRCNILYGTQSQYNQWKRNSILDYTQPKNLYLPIASVISTYGATNGTVEFIDAPNVLKVEMSGCQCGNLKSISLPKASIFGYQAFAGCSRLSTIVLPKARSFSSMVFARTSVLKSIYLLDTVKVTHDSYFLSLTYQPTLYVRDVVYSQYLADSIITGSCTLVSLTKAEADQIIANS